jgi:hypothetical protein
LAAIGRTSWALTFALVCIGWVFFRATNTSHALSMLGSMAGAHAGAPSMLSSLQRAVVLVVTAGTLMIEAIQEQLASRRLRMGVGERQQRLHSWGVPLRPLGFFALFIMAVLLQPSDAGRFIYFQF